MQILFHGDHSAEEAAESLLSILKLFKDRYSIDNYRSMNLNLTLLNEEGEDVELVDVGSSEVLGVFEVYKSGVEESNSILPNERAVPHLQLVVDNTKKQKNKGN